MFRIKICGIRSLRDARAVCEAGGDAVGFNFYPQSSRYISPDSASAISRELPPTVMKVGVFVNQAADSIDEICRQVGLDCVQLHGDELPTWLAELPRSVSVIRSFRLASGELTEVAEYLDKCARRGRSPDAVLADARVTGTYGGTGHCLDWETLADQKPLLGSVPIILAGGLTPENVTSAVELVRPYGVDAASGVEASPGIKDHQAVRQFITQARTALCD